MNEEACPSCNKNFPTHLLSDMAIGDAGGLRYERKCPICALKFRNEAAKLPASIGFRMGSKASEMYKEAVAWLKTTRQNDA